MASLVVPVFSSCTCHASLGGRKASGYGRVADDASRHRVASCVRKVSRCVGIHWDCFAVNVSYLVDGELPG